MARQFQHLRCDLTLSGDFAFWGLEASKSKITWQWHPNQTAQAWVPLPAMTWQVMADSVDRTTEAQTADQLPNHSRGLGWNCRKWSTKQCAFLPSQYQRQARSVSP